MTKYIAFREGAPSGDCQHPITEEELRARLESQCGAPQRARHHRVYHVQLGQCWWRHLSVCRDSGQRRADEIQLQYGELHD